MKKISQIGLVVLTVVLSAFLILKLIDLLVFILDCIFKYPLHTALYTIGMLTLLYIYYKLKDRYGR